MLACIGSDNIRTSGHPTWEVLGSDYFQSPEEMCTILVKAE